MEKNQPQMIIVGHLFNVDFEKKEFVRFDDENNTFPFKKLVEKNGFYVCAHDWGFLEQPDDNRLTVSIPKECIDNEKTLMDKAYTRQFNQVNSKYPRELILIDDEIEQRLLGKLPTIDIAGDKYIVDWKQKELRLDGNASIKIQLWNLEVNKRSIYQDDQNTYEAFYHVPSKTVVDIDPGITVMPKDVVLLDIPNEVTLDPIGVALRSRRDPTSLLRLHPMPVDLKAKVSPISSSWFPGIVRDNVAKTNKIQKKQHTTPKKKRSFRL